MSEKLTQAKYSEWSASLFGASVLSFGLGVWLTDYFQPFMWGIILTGIIIHAWGMYAIHQRNRTKEEKK